MDTGGVPRTIAATGPAAPATVWERYTRPSLWPTWSPQISEVATTRDAVEPGLRGVVHGPLVVRVPFRIEEVDPGERRWSWRVGVGAVSVRMEHGVDAVDGGSRAWARIHLPGLLCAPYEPLARLALGRLVACG